jgi:membrane associated rhomboid family serine protease
MAFFQDNRPSREPFLNAPPTVLWLIALLLATHGLRVLLPGTWPDDIIENYAFIPARYSDWLAQGALAGRVLALAAPLVSYMFLHGDITHVGINSLWLLVFGPLVVRRLRTPKFLLFFFFCGIVAALVHLAVYWGSPMAVVGASGAVSGLMGAGMRILYGRVYGAPNGLAPVFSKPILGFSAVWIFANIVSGVLRIGVTDELALVAWVAHLGGYFAGLTTIGSFDRMPWGRRGWRVA